ncbi:MAG: DUF368 domain-containing protein [Acholeplasmatales bacterium]|nr:DUF368 domain-containing protein [Acholeplasmatales bacterium]
MKWFLDLIKGFLMGISNIIPGFSGGTMAVILKIYDRMIYDLSDITKHPIKAIKDLIFIGIGLLVGMVFAMFTIVFLLEKFPFPTIIFFVGLIIGCLPQMFMQSYEAKKSKLDYLWIIPGLALIVIIPLLSAGDAQLEISFTALLLLAIMGIVSSASMVIPGLSGSLTLMAFGYYTLVLTSGTDLMKGIFDGSNVWDEFIVMAVFAVSCVVGVLLISKLMGILLKRWKGAVYFFIFGLIVGSPFSIIWAACHNDEYDINFKSAGMWCASIICLIIGCSLPLLVRFIEKRMNEKKTLEESDSNDATLNEQEQKDIVNEEQ